MITVLLSLLIKSLFIGIIVAFPMGPVGALCVRRSLSDGFRPGFYTGVGAALSDLIYALLVFCSAGFIGHFFDSNEAAIRLLGAAFMIVFGVYQTFYAKEFIDQPNRSSCRLSKSSDGTSRLIPVGRSAKYYVWSGFALAISNPAMFFFFVMLFSRFNVVTGHLPFYLLLAVSLSAIFIGALFGWLFLVKLVHRSRFRIKEGGIRWFNRIIGIFFILVGLLGLLDLIGLF